MVWAAVSTPSPYASSDVISRAAMNSVTITAPWTVDFHWTNGNVENILETQLDEGTASQDYVAQEAVSLWGNLNDWHHAIGTEPFILTDFVDSSSATVVRIPLIGDSMNVILRINCLMLMASMF